MITLFFFALGFYIVWAIFKIFIEQLKCIWGIISYLLMGVCVLFIVSCSPANDDEQNRICREIIDTELEVISKQDSVLMILNHYLNGNYDAVQRRENNLQLKVDSLYNELLVMRSPLHTAAIRREYQEWRDSLPDVYQGYLNKWEIVRLAQEEYECYITQHTDWDIKGQLIELTK